MKKPVLIFGLISGAISSGMMLATVPFIDHLTFSQGAVIGYTSIVLSSLVVYFGIRSYRDNVRDGQIGFGRGFAVGLLIVLISCSCYVFTWEILYFKVMPDFGAKFTAHMVKSVRDKGGSQQEIDEATKRAAEFKKMYDNPVNNAALTFTEPFPVALVICLISAAILRKTPAAAS